MDKLKTEIGKKVLNWVMTTMMYLNSHFNLYSKYEDKYKRSLYRIPKFEIMELEKVNIVCTCTKCKWESFSSHAKCCKLNR